MCVCVGDTFRGGGSGVGFLWSSVAGVGVGNI